GQMKDAASLAKACPDVTFVLQHAGMLEDLSEKGVAAWRNGMERLANEPNVVSKLSAFGTFIHRNDADHIKMILTDTVEMFGAERCLFGSNYPIEKLWTSYADLVSAFKKAASGLSKADQKAIFHDTAQRVYNL
ncbi:MAG: amidohydrolase family protein, partial [Pseudomonadota bacterium]